MGVANPYQDVIDWLRTPEGERWSEERMRVARVMHSSGQLTLTAYGDKELLIWKGILSVKSDEDFRHTATFRHTHTWE